MLYTLQATGQAPETKDTAAAAVHRGASFVYLAPYDQPGHIERLAKTGQTAWAYGFNTMTITAVADEVAQTPQSDQLSETFGECVRRHAAPNDNPYVMAARNTPLVQSNHEDLELDEAVVLSEGEGGAWAMAWIWISDAEAGIATEEEDA